MVGQVPQGIGQRVASNLASQGFGSAGNSAAPSAMGALGGGIASKLGTGIGAGQAATMAAGAAAGQVIAKGAEVVISSFAANLFMIIAVLSRLLDGYLTGWTFGVNTYTLYIDIAMLFYCVIAFKKDKLDKSIAGFVAFIVFASYILPLVEKQLLNKVSFLSYPILILIIGSIAAYILYKREDKELAIIFFIFMLEIGIPFLNMQFNSFFLANKWTILLLFWPFWATYAAKYSDTKLSALVFIGMIVFVLLFFKPFTFAALDEFKVDNVISESQKNDARTGMGNIELMWTDFKDNVACGWKVLLQNDQNCFDDLAKKKKADQQVEEVVEIYLYPFEKDQTIYTTQKTWQYTMNARIKNKMDDDMKVYLACGTSTRPTEIAESDETTGTVVGYSTTNPLVVKKDKIFNQPLTCGVTTPPDLKRPIIFYKAKVKDIKATSTYRRLIVEEKDPQKSQMYTQIINEKFMGQTYDAVATRSFAKLDIYMDKGYKQPMIEMKRDSTFQLHADLYNNGNGEIDLKKASVKLPTGFTAISCNGYDAKTNTITYDVKSQPFNQISKSNHLSFAPCTVKFDIDSGLLNQASDVQRVYPTLYTIEGEILYDYTVTAYKSLIIKDQTKVTNNNIVVEAGTT